MFSAEKYFDPNRGLIRDFLASYDNLWDALPHIEIFLKNFKGGGSFERLENNVWIESGAEVEEGAKLQRNIIVRSGTLIKSHAIVRENCIIDKNCIIGNFTEIKNSILLESVSMPHFNYAGDSILGQRAHLGAGAKISNLKSTGGTVKVKMPDKTFDTGLEKFGAIIGSGTEIGCNAVLNPGSVTGKNCVVYPMVSFRGVLEEGTIVKLRQTFQYEEKRHD